MSEKRYTVIDREEPKGESVAEDGLPCTARYCSIILNNLIEENEHLKMEYKDLKSRFDNTDTFETNLLIENEELKEENNYLKRILKYIVYEIESEYGAIQRRYILKCDIDNVMYDMVKKVVFDEV